MTPEQLSQYDRFLDENDWDIYYWTTQNPPSTSHEYAEGGSPTLATPTAAGHSASPADSRDSTSAQGKASAGQTAFGQAAPQSEATMQGQGQGMGASFGEGPVGEWAQTVGRVKEPYRPPPSRWRDSEILAMLRAHVKSRAGNTDGGEQLRRGLGRMPDVRRF